MLTPYATRQFPLRTRILAIFTITLHFAKFPMTSMITTSIWNIHAICAFSFVYAQVRSHFIPSIHIHFRNSKEYIYALSCAFLSIMYAPLIIPSDTISIPASFLNVIFTNVAHNIRNLISWYRRHLHFLFLCFVAFELIISVFRSYSNVAPKTTPFRTLRVHDSSLILTSGTLPRM